MPRFALLHDGLLDQFALVAKVVGKLTLLWLLQPIGTWTMPSTRTRSQRPDNFQRFSGLLVADLEAAEAPIGYAGGSNVDSPMTSAELLHHSTDFRG